MPTIRDDDGTWNILNSKFSVVFANDTLGFYEDVGGTVNVRYGKNEISDLLVTVKESDWVGIDQSFDSNDWYAIVEYTDDRGNKEELDTRNINLLWSLPQLDPTLGRTLPVETSDNSISISSSTFNENLETAHIVGQITADYGSSSIWSGPPQYSATLAAGDGDTDNDKFRINSVTEFIGFFNDTTHNLVLINSADYEVQSEYSIRLKTVDSNGIEAERSFVLSVNDLNEDPTDLLVSASSFEENITAGTVVAELSSTDEDSGDTHTYSLVFGDGSEDNESFEIVGDELKIKESPDFETKISYFIRVRTTDSGGLTFEKAFTLTVNELNEVSTDITLSAPTFDENIAGGSAVATLSTTDPDAEDTHTYSLVSGTGDTDNNAFTIDGDELKIKESPDFETKSSYSIRVQTKDSGALNFEKSFILSVNDLNDAPTDLSVSASTFDENIASGSAVATLSTSDPDADDTHTYAMISGTGDTDNGAFTIDGDQLKITDSPDIETKSSYSVRIQTTDSGGLTFEKAFTLTVNDLEEGQPDLDKDGFVDDITHYQMWTESGGVDLTNKNGRKLSDKTSGLWDAIKAVQTYSGFSVLLQGDRKKQGKYRIWKTNENGRLQSQSPWKSAQQMFESGSEDTFETDFNGNDQIGFVAPTGITLSTFSFNENLAKGSIISSLSSTDPDPGDTHTYSLVSGSGDTDNSSFTIQKDQLTINASPNYETKSSYSIRLRTTDSSGGLSHEEPFTLTVNDLDEPVVEDLDGDGFVDGITNYQVLTNGGGVDLINKRKFSDQSSRRWDAVKAITTDSSIQVLIEGTGKKNGKFKMWFANPESGKITSQTKWKKESWMTNQGYENIFDYDINSNGVIGS